MPSPKGTSANYLCVPDLGYRPVSSATRNGAIFAAGLMAVLTAIALVYDQSLTDPMDCIVAVYATIWFSAGYLTALLLYGQFYITRALGFLIFGSAYAFSALLAVPYLLSIPGMNLISPTALSDSQVTGALWMSWHISFPLIMSLGFIVDPLLSRKCDRHEVVRLLKIMIVLVICVAVALAIAFWFNRAALPIVVIAHHPTPFYRYIVAPIVVMMNLIACLLAIARGRGATSLSVWIAFATFAATLDALTNGLSKQTFSLAWYFSKFQTTLTTTIVLAMLLLEIALLYRQLAELATQDALTELRNRRGLDEHLRWTHGHAQRSGLGLAMLILDVDNFKSYNDRYGHTQGDRALRTVAALLRTSATRAYDMAARYGGEEFAIILVDVSEEEALGVAERLRRLVHNAEIAHEGAPFGKLSISIGIGHIENARMADVTDLIEAADSALYRAKGSGRNCCVISALGDSLAVAGDRRA